MEVGKREKKGEGGAWTLCSGLPSRRESNRTTKVGRREKKGEVSAWTLCSGLPSRREGMNHEYYTVFVYFVYFVV